MDIRTYFNIEEKSQIKEAIKQAELRTSGEIRVHLETHCDGQAMERAIRWFEKLKMHKTEARNGVLIYVAVESKKFAILGDQGINEVVPKTFWNDTKELMVASFKEGQILKGICEGIEKAGEQLRQYFPYQKDDVNELDDDLSYGNQ